MRADLGQTWMPPGTARHYGRGARGWRQAEQVQGAVNLCVEVRDAEGRLLSRERGHNLVPTAGRNLLRNFLNGDAPAGITHFGIGTGSTAVSNNDTALGTEVLREVVTSKTKTDLKLTVKYYLAVGSGNGNTIREAGLFNAAAAGTMYARYVLTSSIVKTSSIAVTFTWELTWTVTAMNILERGSVIELGGNQDGFITGNAYPTGATYNKLVPGSGVWYIDSADLQGGTFAIEALAKVGNGTAKATIGLFNLDDGAPNTVLVGSDVQGTAGQTTGERLRSGSITFPSAGTPKHLAVKAKTDEAAGKAYVWGIRIIRLS